MFFGGHDDEYEYQVPGIAFLEVERPGSTIARLVGQGPTPAAACTLQVQHAVVHTPDTEQT